MKNDPEEEAKKLRFWLHSLSVHAKKAPVFLIGTHCEDSTPDANQTADSAIQQLIKENQEVTFVPNKEGELLYFPVDNSLGKDNDKYLSGLRSQVCQMKFA